MTHGYAFKPLNFAYLTPEEQHRRSSEFLAHMRTRRTVRDFDTRPVPFELIQNAVATASTAPSGANQQPWTFAVVSNPDLKRQIRIAAEAEEKESYERRMSQEWLDALAPLGTDWTKPHIEDAPYLIIVFAQSQGIRKNVDTGEETTFKHYYVSESVGIAVGMLLASLHLAGLATLTHTPSPMGFLGQLLNRPAHERAMILIPVGYPKPDATVPDITKKPLDEVMVVYD
ncbi:MAG: nitroreductase family protein [Anaerolineae bacterium]|nr:nitroreductase family protein [Anaerolineae bacterium]